MAFTERREYLFLYTVKDANPNGDPLNENHPRYDADTNQAMASDVRVKRTTRDEWIRREELVLIDGKAKSLKTRLEELKKITGKSNAEDIIKECLDARIFGVTFTLGKGNNQKTFSWTGPIQLKWARSLHSATFQFIQGTSAFATETKTGEDKQQRSFRNEYLVPFALMGVYAIANQNASQETGATDEDIEKFINAMWEGTNNLITRSKNEHKSRFLMEIKYKEGFNGKIGGLDEKILLLDSDGNKMDVERQKAIRSLQEVSLDFSPLLSAINAKKESISQIRIINDGELKILQNEELEGLSEFEVR